MACCLRSRGVYVCDNDYSLSRSQERLLKNPTSENIVSRVGTYVKDHPKVLYEIFLSNGKSFTHKDLRQYFIAAVLGDSIATLQGAYIQDPSGASYISISDGERTTRLIFAKGGSTIFKRNIVVAFTIVAAGNAIRNVFRIYTSTDYANWGLERERQLRDRSHHDFLLTDPFLKGYRCPIKGTIFKSPQIAPNEIRYELKAVSQWLRDNPGRIRQEGTRVLFSASDLQFDYAIANSVLSRLVLIKQDLSRYPNVSSFEDYIQRMINIRKKIKRKAFQKESSKGVRALLERTISESKNTERHEKRTESYFKHKTVVEYTDCCIIGFIKDCFGWRRSVRYLRVLIDDDEKSQIS